MAHAVQAVAPQHHEVLFYDVDTELADAVVDYVGAGLSVGELIVVIATAPHLAAIDAALPEARGSYLALDAAETLDSFTVDGSPDAVGFTRVVGGILDAAELDGAPVRFFGEMVALLWQEGDVAGAMALEATWNDLATYRQFSLLCAYPTTALGSAELCDVNQVCQLHSLVLPPPSYGSAFSRSIEVVATSASKVFVAAPEAVYAAREFVRDTLTSWGENHLVWDGSLIISELATNAIIHGGSPFRVGIELAPEVVRISVEDVGPGLPHSRRVFRNALGGRGVAIVEELSHRWGCDPLEGGKVFWVELETALAQAL